MSLKVSGRTEETTLLEAIRAVAELIEQGIREGKREETAAYCRRIVRAVPPAGHTTRATCKINNPEQPL